MADPTLDQLARFACVQMWGPYAVGPNFDAVRSWLTVSPTIERVWRERHAEFQASLSGRGEEPADG